MVRGWATQASSAWVDVVSNRGSVQYLKVPVSSPPNEVPDVIAEGVVTLEVPVDDIEVRVYVGTNDVVRMTGYEFLPVDH